MELCENKTYNLRENKTGQEHYGCRFRYVFGKDCIRFYFDVKDEDIISPYRNDNEDIWHGDAVEVFISPDGDTKRYKEIEVSPFGVQFYGEIANADGQTPRLKKTEPEYDADAVRTEYGYSVTIRLPFKAMKRFDRLKMKLNAFWLDKKESGEQELYALNPTFCDSFHRPKYFVSEGSKQMQMDGKLLVEKLLAYAKAHLCLREEDEVYMRNVLLSQFGFSEPYEGEADVSAEVSADVPDALAEELKAFALEAGLCTEDFAERYVADVFGMLTPLPSEVNRITSIIRVEGI